MDPSDAAGRVLADLIDIGRTRVQLAALELEDGRAHLARRWIAAVLALFLLFAGVLLGAAWLVLACAPAQRLVALGALALGFLAAAALAAWRWRWLAATQPGLLQATLAELRQDRDALRRGARA